MQAIKKVLKIEKGKVMIDIPESFGKEVEVIILPVKKERERDISYYLMKYQEETGFVNKVLGDEREEVWSEV